MDSSSIRILIADDHPIFREGLRTLLTAEPDLKVVGEASDGQEAVALAEELKPDVLLLDLNMPHMPGLEALRELADSSSPVRTILLTAAIETKGIVEALQLGARGIVMKDAAVELLLDCIRAVMCEQYWVGRGHVSSLIQALGTLVPEGAKSAKPFAHGLTPRELEIVTAIAKGMANKDVARTFGISEATVKHHLTNIFQKLRVSNRLELALFAVNRGLVTPS